MSAKGTQRAHDRQKDIPHPPFTPAEELAFNFGRHSASKLMAMTPSFRGLPEGCRGPLACFSLGETASNAQPGKPPSFPGQNTQLEGHFDLGEQSKLRAIKL
jgi:hypothetical protein